MVLFGCLVINIITMIYGVDGSVQTILFDFAFEGDGSVVYVQITNQFITFGMGE